MLLLKSGASLTAVEDGGNTALLLAVGRGHADIVKVRFPRSALTIQLLVKAGAEINSCDAEHRTALHWATKIKSPAILQLLLPHSFR